MGRKEERKLKKLKGESLKKAKISPPPLMSFIEGDTRYVPITLDNVKGPVSSERPASLSRDEFEKSTHELSDQELNRIIYQDALFAVNNGLMPPRPEDDFGTVMWFTWNFITPEMREAFPEITKEYLAHYKTSDNEKGIHFENSDLKTSWSEEKACVDQDWNFRNIPYPRMNERTWDDAYYFRILLMMLYSARAGSKYSRNFLLSLYKVYYKPEYNRLKRLKILTYLDILELHDEDCYRRGLSSGHTENGNISFKEMTIEQRRHEPGWTDVYGDRALTPVPGKRRSDMKDAEELNHAAKEISLVADAPDEPPLQPAASRLIIICELLGIPLDETCNQQVLQMNEIVENMTKLAFLASPEYRKIWGEAAERTRGMLKAEYPEMFDPYKYQKDKQYLGLQIAELVMSDVFKKYDANVRLPYNSRQFDLASLVSDLTVTLNMNFPDIQIGFSDVLILAMVQYLSECLCEVMNVRDSELEEILRFQRRKETGEWQPDRETDKDSAERVLREKDRLGEHPDREEGKEGTVPDDRQQNEIERLRKQLEEKEAALSEAEQKIIRQRVLYEKAHKRELELSQKAEEQSVEHTELLALREYVYRLKTSDSPGTEENTPGLNDETREELIDMIKGKKVAVLGGTERWIKRMRRLLPAWSFISVEDDNIGSYNALERADFIYIYTSALKHSQYYKAMGIIKNKEKMLFYLGSTNTDECLQQFRRELCSKR